MKITKKLSDKQREEAVKIYLTSGYSLKEVGEMYGVSKQNIFALINSKKRKDKTIEAMEKLKLENKNI
jgi:predicted DNA-binding protein YlxM (UPF0122 family)